MADFKISILKTLVHEGGYVNNPNDAGGETNFGISKANFPNEDIKNMTRDRAVEIYREGYWKDLYSQIDAQDVADKLFDLGVLFGVGTAVRILQLTLKITQDGGFGVNTLAAVNQENAETLLSDFKANMMTHAFNIATAKPQNRVFLKGWGARINS
jgi:lysozyme family protein